MDINKIYTEEEQKNIENLASENNFKDISVKLGFSENQFIKLRKNHKQVKEAVDKGVLARGQAYKNKYRKRLSNAAKKYHDAKTLNTKIPTEIDPTAALKKFKEEFERNKRIESYKELRNLDIL